MALNPKLTHRQIWEESSCSKTIFLPFSIFCGMTCMTFARGEQIQISGRTLSVGRNTVTTHISGPLWGSFLYKRWEFHVFLRNNNRGLKFQTSRHVQDPKIHWPWPRHQRHSYAYFRPRGSVLEYVLFRLPFSVCWNFFLDKELLNWARPITLMVKWPTARTPLSLLHRYTIINITSANRAVYLVLFVLQITPGNIVIAETWQECAVRYTTLGFPNLESVFFLTINFL